MTISNWRSGRWARLAAMVCAVMLESQPFRQLNRLAVMGEPQLRTAGFEGADADHPRPGR